MMKTNAETSVADGKGWSARAPLVALVTLLLATALWGKFNAGSLDEAVVGTWGFSETEAWLLLAEDGTGLIEGERITYWIEGNLVRLHRRYSPKSGDALRKITVGRPDDGLIYHNLEVLDWSENSLTLKTRDGPLRLHRVATGNERKRNTGGRPEPGFTRVAQQRWQRR